MSPKLVTRSLTAVPHVPRVPRPPRTAVPPFVRVHILWPRPGQLVARSPSLTYITPEAGGGGSVWRRTVHHKPWSPTGRWGPEIRPGSMLIQPNLRDVPHRLHALVVGSLDAAGRAWDSAL